MRRIISLTIIITIFTSTSFARDVELYKGCKLYPQSVALSWKDEKALSMDELIKLDENTLSEIYKDYECKRANLIYYSGRLEQKLSDIPEK
ncbi:hypothetical protein [Serratia liquefaciens]|uniref:hypothetical protein n=1 Tax=Serratia liquefaciens TaxID=614 RepID=UPI002183A0AC|nr:hypothetical protein [Serratia liquefaciens]CAI2538150.1 Uncharacterised protein [Serratia liquefaciens]